VKIRFLLFILPPYNLQSSGIMRDVMTVLVLEQYLKAHSALYDFSEQDLFSIN
jgi:hypothetical protein